MKIENISVCEDSSKGIPISVSLIVDGKNCVVPVSRCPYYLVNGTDYPSYLELIELLTVTSCNYILLEGFSVISVSESLRKLFPDRHKINVGELPKEHVKDITTNIFIAYDTLNCAVRCKYIKVKNRDRTLSLLLVEAIDKVKDLMLLGEAYNKIITDENKNILFISDNIKIACGLEKKIIENTTKLSEIAFFNVESDGTKIMNLNTKKFTFTESVLLDQTNEIHCLDLTLLNDAQTYFALNQSFLAWIKPKLFMLNSYTVTAINISSLQIINNSYGVEYGDRCIHELTNAIRLVDNDCVVYHHHSTGTTFYVSSLTPLQVRVVMEGLYKKLASRFTWLFDMVSFSEIRPSISQESIPEKSAFHNRVAIEDVITFSECVETVSTRLLWEKVSTKNFSARILKNMLEHRTLETKDHCTRIQHASLAIAHVLGENEKFTQEQLSKLGMGAMLHDLGKLFVPPEILHKKGKLTEEEFNIIKQHPVDGANTFKDDKVFEEVYLIIRHHHERYDGRGYPDGISLAELPLTVSIVSFVDTVDAILSNRCYKEAKPLSYLFEEIDKYNGTQFHPKVVDAFMRAYELGMMDGLLNIENNK